MISENEVREMLGDTTPQDVAKLDNMQVGETIATPVNDVIEEYSRSLDSYGTIQQIVEHIHATGDKTQHIYTETLQYGGQAVQDRMSKYLEMRCYSSSMLKAANTTPLHLFFQLEEAWKLEIEKLKTGKHFILGTFLHECILEPTKFSRVVVEPDESRTSIDGIKALIDFWEETIEETLDDEESGRVLEHADRFTDWQLTQQGTKKRDSLKEYLSLLIEQSGLSAVTQKDKTIIDIVKFNYFRYGGGVLPRIMKHSKREISLYGNDPVTDLPVKIRPDSMAFKENIGVNAIISVKSTHAKNIRKFFYDSAKLSYHTTEGFYQDVATWVTGRDFNTTITIMLQTTPPYGVAAFVWPGEAIEWGKYRYKQALQIALECHDRDLYPGFDAYAEAGNLGLIEMVLPNWAQREDNPIDLDN